MILVAVEDMGEEVERLKEKVESAQLGAKGEVALAKSRS
jgi:hypothetical protein